VIFNDSVYVNQLIRVRDTAYSHYVYIKILPPEAVFGTPSGRVTAYQPGFLLDAPTFAGHPYFYAYDCNGNPFWYKKNNSSFGASATPQTATLVLGDINKVSTLIFDVGLCRTVTDVTTGEEIHFRSLKDSRGVSTNPNIWDVHETHYIKAPASRKGNIIFVSYFIGVTGVGPDFYIQEQNQAGEIVWEFYSYDVLANTNNSETYHANSIDVHPETGDLVCSFRTCSVVACINYATKNIDWAIDPNGTLHSLCIDPTLTVFLTPTNEPTWQGNTYNGTDLQHDARWHTDLVPLTPGNKMVSIYDDGSSSGRPARGVLYEIDVAGGIALHRSSVFGPSSSGYMGSYTIRKEINGSYVHVLDLVQMHPASVEYADGGSGLTAGTVGTQDVNFAMDFAGDHYRIVKVTSAQLNVAAMRRTAGMPYTTP
jgi:hypothetical protein